MRVFRLGEAYIVGALQTMDKNMINKNNRVFGRSFIFLPAGPSVRPLKKNGLSWPSVLLKCQGWKRCRDSQPGYTSPRKITRLDQNNKLKLSTCYNTSRMGSIPFQSGLSLSWIDFRTIFSSLYYNESHLGYPNFDQGH